MLLTTARTRRELGLRPRARVVDQCLVGVDPVLMLTGPIDATRRLLERTGLTIDDFDVIEINEAFASVVLAWEREVKPDMAQVNPNGGAIALGPPGRRDRRPARHHRAARARAHRRDRRARHDVLRRRARHRHDPRARVVAAGASWSNCRDSSPTSA